MTTESKTKRPFSHPLFGSSLSNLIRLLWTNGGVSWKYTPQLAVAMLSALVRAPFSLVERIAYDKKLEQLEMKPPVFIIGHWRSGTTHISNLLSQSPRFGFVSPVATGIPHDLLIIGRIFKPWLERSIPSDRWIDRVPVNVHSPQEDEFGVANMIPSSFLHGLYFPRQFQRNFSKGVFLDGCSEDEIKSWKEASTRYLRKIYLEQGKRQLLIRNPIYTARIPLLRTMWAGARFIHIYRDPYKVFPSMKNYFSKLFPALALQEYQQLDVEGVIFDTYQHMMSTVINDLAQTPAEEFIEIKYEELEEAPLRQLELIYQRLDLPGYRDSKAYFEQYLDGIRGYTKNKYLQSQQERAMIRQHWGDFIEHYGY